MALELAGEVTLVDKASLKGCLRDGQAEGKERFGAGDANLREVEMWGQTGLLLEDAQQVKWAEVGNGGKLFERDVFSIMRLYILAHAPHRLAFLLYCSCL